jgi:hypothetical protein
MIRARVRGGRAYPRTAALFGPAGLFVRSGIVDNPNLPSIATSLVDLWEFDCRFGHQAVDRCQVRGPQVQVLERHDLGAFEYCHQVDAKVESFSFDGEQVSLAISLPTGSERNGTRFMSRSRLTSRFFGRSRP